MKNDEKIEEGLKHNESFIRAFDYWATRIGFTQKSLAENIGSSSSSISIYRKGLKKVSRDTMQKLVNFSKGKLNIEYMMGISEYMLTENKPADEYSEAKKRQENPDYDIMRARTEKEEREINEMLNNGQSVSISSLVNAALAAKDMTISSLERELNTKDDLIDMLHAQVASLQRQIDEYHKFKTTAFSTGVAEPKYEEK